MNLQSDKLLKAVEKKQKEGQFNDSAFARKLGIARPIWIEAKTKKRPIGMTLLKAITRTFPDLSGEIIEFLKDDGTWKWQPDRFAVPIGRRQADAG